MTQTKICCNCKNSKLLIDFCKNKNSKDLHSVQCKDCAKEYRNLNKNKKYASSAIEYRQNYIHSNRDHINKVRRERSKLNPTKVKIDNHNNYVKHKEKRIEYNKQYYVDHKIEAAIRSKKFRKLNKLSILLRNRKRQKKLGAINIKQSQINNLLNIYNNCCYYCKVDIKQGINLHLDHRVPLSRGGQHSINNLAPACQSCNLKKGTKTDLEYFRTLQRVK